MRANDAGRWEILLPPLPVGGPHELVLSESAGETVCRNVSIGEVWVCSGQSNMEWPLIQCSNQDAEIEAARDAAPRLLTVPRAGSRLPREHVGGTWLPCTPESAAPFSGVAYFFGRRLRRELGVPVGLIHASWGGTPAEAWMPWDTLAGNADYRPILDRFETLLASTESDMTTYLRTFEQWRQAVAQEGDRIPDPPAAPPDGRHGGWRPSGLFNAMIAPLTRYTVRGVGRQRNPPAAPLRQREHLYRAPTGKIQMRFIPKPVQLTAVRRPARQTR